MLQDMSKEIALAERNKWASLDSLKQSAASLQSRELETMTDVISYAISFYTLEKEFLEKKLQAFGGPSRELDKVSTNEKPQIQKKLQDTETTLSIYTLLDGNKERVKDILLGRH